MSLFKWIWSNKEDRFWLWFKKNEINLINIKSRNDPFLGELSKQLHKVHPDITFEMSAAEINGKFEFAISADGRKELIEPVLKLYNKKPKSDRFEIKAFRQCTDQIFDLTMGNIIIKANEIKYLLIEDENEGKIGIVRDLKTPLGAVTDNMERSLYIKELAERIERLNAQAERWQQVISAREEKLQKAD